MTGRPNAYGDASQPRAAFGEALRDARELRPAGRLSQTDLAKLARTSKSTISRIERGVPPIPGNLPTLFDRIFETNGQFKRLYEEVFDKSFPTLFQRRMALERQATEIWEWSPTLIPGLLQTAEYARTLFRYAVPRLSDEEIVTLVRTRITRQELLFRSAAPPTFRVVVCESVIQRRIGTHDMMREQLAALLRVGTQPTTRIQVLPLDSEPHLLVDGPVTLLKLPNNAAVYCVEAFRREASITADPESVRTAIHAYDDLTGDALSARDSAAFIKKEMETL